MASLSQNEWNRIHCTADEFSIFIPPAQAPSESWWICSREEFQARLIREVPRMNGSKMALTIRPVMLGGKLP